MKKKRIAVNAVALAAVIMGASAYADTVDNPGEVTITFVNTDSRVSVNGKNIFVNSTQSAYLYGSVASDGSMYFDQSDISFEVGTSGSYNVRLVATSDATGALCPNAGDADITFTARLDVTGGGVNCRIPIGTITLTTKTSGALTGSPFNSMEPVLVSSSTFSQAVGPLCTGAAPGIVNAYFGLAQTGTIELVDAGMSTNFGGTGC